MLEIAILTGWATFTLSSTIPTASTVKTQLLLCKKFLTPIKSGHIWAIFRNMIIFTAVNTGSLSMLVVLIMEELRLSLTLFRLLIRITVLYRIDVFSLF